MLPYVLVYITVVIASFFAQAKTIKIFKILASAIIILSLAILYLIRDYTIGTDTLNYIPIFSALDNNHDILSPFYYSILYNFEVGFTYISFILVNLFHEPYLIFFIYTLLIYSCVWFVIQKSKLNPTLLYASIFSFFSFYLYSFNILRQCIAIALIMLAVHFLLNQRNKKFILLILAASLFHYPAIVCLGFYFIYKFRNLLYRLWFVVIPVVAITAEIAFKFVIDSSEKYKLYAEGDDLTQSLSISVLSFYIFIFLCSILFLRIVKPENRDNFKFYSILFYVYLGIQAFLIIFDGLNQAIARMSLYFLFSSIFIIPYILNGIKNNNLRYVFNILYLLFLSFYFIYVISNKGVEYMPFRLHYDFIIF